MIQIVAIDDEQLPLQLVQEYCAQITDITSIHTFNKLKSAKEFVENNMVNVLILDIEMPQQNGIEFYNSLARKPLLILATAYPQYALQGFQIQASSYLLKPFSFAEFTQAIDKARIQLIGEQAKNYAGFLTVSVNYTTIPILFDTIIYIESFGDFVTIHTTKAEVIKTRYTMKALLQELPEVNFIRVHRSYIIAIAHIKSIRRKVISIADILIPIGSSYEKEVDKIIK
jgi:DNA-binding LytR/AlgR family response regulator